MIIIIVNFIRKIIILNYFFKGGKYFENITAKDLCSCSIAKQLWFSTLTSEEQLFWGLGSPGVTAWANSVRSLHAHSDEVLLVQVQCAGCTWVVFCCAEAPSVLRFPFPSTNPYWAKTVEDLGGTEQFSDIRTSGALNQSISWQTWGDLLVDCHPWSQNWWRDWCKAVQCYHWTDEEHHNGGEGSVHRNFRSIVVLLHMDLLQNTIFHADTGCGSHQFEHS